MELTTKRLRICPLTGSQLRQLLDDAGLLAKDLGLRASLRPLDSDTQTAMEWLYREGTAHPDSRLWFANWQIIHQSGQLAVGSACFKGPPDALGWVEVGYGIEPEHQRQGYMTEALDALCRWAFAHPQVRAVVAETQRDNAASYRVLQKCGFAQVDETELLFRWKLSKGRHKIIL